MLYYIELFSRFLLAQIQSTLYIRPHPTSTIFLVKYPGIFQLVCSSSKVLHMQIGIPCPPFFISTCSFNFEQYTYGLFDFVISTILNVLDSLLFLSHAKIIHTYLPTYLHIFLGKKLFDKYDTVGHNLTFNTSYKVSLGLMHQAYLD